MSRKIVVRLQLLVLAALALALVGRGLVGRFSEPDGLALVDVERYGLKHLSFEVPVPVTVEVTATGSIEADQNDAPLAAYAWLMRRGQHEPVWVQSATSEGRDGTLVREKAEVALQPGTYDLYFAAFGHDMTTGRRGEGFLYRLFTRRPSWEGDQGDWQVNLVPVDADAGRIQLASGREFHFGDSHLVWSAAPMEDQDSARLLFEVLQAIELHVYAIGEIQPNGKDYGWIDDLTRSQRVWELGIDNTTAAGGHPANRKFEGTIQLQPGVYAASFETDAGHAYSRWLAAPPFEPRLWGLTLTADEGSAEQVRPFDPWEDREPLLELTRMENSRRERVDFRVEEPIGVLIAGLGEMRSQERYDYGWIEDDSGQPVWEMRYEDSGHAGGEARNRELQQFLTFGRGAYSLHYRTDDSHAYGDWRGDRPRNPEHWGVTIFPVDDAPPGSRFRVVNRVSEHLDAPDRPDIPVPPHPPGLGQDVLAHIGSVGNGQSLSQEFELNSPATVLIHAQGELLPDERFDYAWIVREDDGRTVWEMTWANTSPAGMDDRNRLFEGEVTLDAGRYVVHYTSDASHAFGDFGKIAPDEADFWGIRLSLAP